MKPSSFYDRVVDVPRLVAHYGIGEALPPPIAAAKRLVEELFHECRVEWRVPDKEPKEEGLSEDDKILKEELDLCVTRLQENDVKLYHGALESLRKLIRASTTSMTSVPKPLKFMIEHYDTMKAVYEKIDGNAMRQVKSDCADIVSVLSMTMGENNECLKYKLLGDTSLENLEAWGHEYVRHLAGEIVAEWNTIGDEPVEGATDQVFNKINILRRLK